MNAGPTSERVYAALKRLVLERRFRPGERLDPGRLADALGSSVTPVRDGLNVLAGEGLVETRTSDGYSIPHIDEPGLLDLYRWNAALLRLAARTVPRATFASLAEIRADCTVQATAAAFDAIARLTDNAECVRAIAALNDRTSAIRHAEAVVFDDIQSELTEMLSMLASGEMRELGKAIIRYHRRREHHASAILRAHYRAPAD
jgi:DNA-binding GntR family transcriptional regulator